MICVDVDPHRVTAVNNRESPVIDAELSLYLRERPLDIRATLEVPEALRGRSIWR